MKIKNLISIIFCAIILIACEESAPFEYKKDFVVRALLTVNEPINKIWIYQSQPLLDTLKYSKTFVDTAIVRISEGTNIYNLKYRFNGEYGEYYNEDTNIRVKPNTKYSLEIILDGQKMTGETTTPDIISWNKRPHKILNYPSNPMDLLTGDTNLYISWTKSTIAPAYILSIKCLDSLNYGKYLNPITEEKNARIYKWFEDNKEESPLWKDTTKWAYVESNSSPTVWLAFKWYGLHEISVLASDKNYTNWFKMIAWGGNPSYNPSLGSIKNGKGVFGSVAVIKDTAFLVKPK